jgi:GrpB-like predicted nucleotidyltransferase (UPF0157 family)
MDRERAAAIANVPCSRRDAQVGANLFRHLTCVWFRDEIVAPMAWALRDRNCREMILVPYNPEWASEFAALRDVYASSLGGLILRIEHVGSTAVPNLSAKPILDIDVVMPSYDVFPEIVERLGRLGYTHNGDQGIREREVFKPLGNRAPYTFPPKNWIPHHLYVCPVNGRELSRHLIFRDTLRAHDDLRQEYEKRKTDIAGRSGGDRKAYARIKEIEFRGFVERVLAIGGHGHGA